MKYGLSDDIVARICGVFARFPAIEKAVLYGSRAKGNYKPGSDIDLTLYGENLTPSQLGDIAEELDDLLLPYMFDLSIFDDLGHADLRGHIERVGQVFYEKRCDKGDGAGLAGVR
jgi:predicted nucleotidyltransferase